MRNFLSTLFGDLRNCFVVGAVVAGEAILVHAGFAQEAVFAVPVATLAGVAWLSRPRA